MQCQSCWTRSGLSCYLLVTVPKSWDAARADCISKGGNLTSITSVDENSFVLSLRGTFTDDLKDAWIGLHDQVVENTFVWIDGTNSTYTNWNTRTNEPNNVGGADCVRIASDGTWKDQKCGDLYPYVCKYKLTPPTYTTQNPTTLSAMTSATTSVGTSELAVTSKSSITNFPSSAILSNSPPTTVADTMDHPTTRRTTVPLEITTQFTSALATVSKHATSSTQLPTTVTVSTSATPSNRFNLMPKSTSSPTTADASTQLSTTTLKFASSRMATKSGTSTARVSTTLTALANKGKSKSSNKTISAGIAAAVAVIVFIVSVIFAFLFWRRRANKQTSSTLDGSYASSVVANSTILGAQFANRESENVYCEPTTMIVDNTTQAPIQDASKSFHNGTTAGGHFTKRGSTMEVQVYCEPTTQGPIESPVNENGYLVPASTETLGKSQSCNQQTSNQVAVNTTNENEYERAVIGTERDIKNADIVSQSVDTEKAIYALCDADTYVNAPETTSREQNVCKSSNVVLLVLCINRICLYRCLLLH